MKQHRGFTLVEVAIAVVILGLLLGSATMTLSAQMDLKYNAETKRTLELAQEAILGFAAANGRLPCPSDPAGDTGLENPVGGGACVNNFNGFVPAATLGLSPVNGDHQLIDAWGQPIRYAVTKATVASPDAFTTSGQMRNLGLSTLTSSTNNLKICEPVSVVVTACSASTPLASFVYTDMAVVVLASSGKNMAFEDAQFDPATSNDRFFVYRPQSSTADDIVTWVSPYTLFNKMLAAGAL